MELLTKEFGKEMWQSSVGNLLIEMQCSIDTFL
jgi:hypothetical protein